MEMGRRCLGGIGWILRVGGRWRFRRCETGNVRFLYILPLTIVVHQSHFQLLVRTSKCRIPECTSISPLAGLKVLEACASSHPDELD